MKLKITIEGIAYEVEVEALPEDTRPTLRGNHSVASPPLAKAKAEPTVPQSVEGAIPSPLAGVVTTIHVNEGDTVTAGQTIAVIEAMKMLTNISAPSAGVVKAVYVAVGDGVKQGAPVALVEGE